ncbi:MAG TPA: xanthine dehydrogenase family protein molybdopterin-binding subunit [Chitinophagaceae bacterium]
MQTTDKNLSRRNFIRISGMTGAALTIGYAMPGLANEAAEILTAQKAVEQGIELTAWISIDKTGKVSILNHRSEMGQGSFQTVPQMIAEELEVSLDNVNIAFAQGHPSKFGSQVTGGSSTVRGAYKTLLQTGATAREMLIEAASKKWSVSKNDCYAENGFVIHKPTGKKLGYGELVEDASKLTPPKEVKLKRREEYKIIGKPLPRQDIPNKINGKAEFGLDVKLPGMLYAVIERNPRFKGKVKGFDDSASMKVAGVKKVLKTSAPVFAYEREGVAVIADSLWAALEGRKALKVEWDDMRIERLNTDQLYARMKEDLKKHALSQRSGGNADGVFQRTENKVEAIYETPYEAHACMEPLTCTAHVLGDKVEVWGPIQAPDWVQRDISGRLKLNPENVKVNMTFLGGGFGRKAFTDYTYEPVLLSKEMNAPVQVVWTREDDMTQGPFRPGAVYECKGSIDGEKINSFQAKMAAQNMDHQWSPNPDRSAFNTSTTEGFLETYFENIPHYSFGDVPTESPIPVMWWRSVYSSTNGFAYESFMDELALKAGKDPLEFRMNHFSNERYRLLAEKLRDVSGWGSKGKYQGYGVAITECFKSIVGEVVKVSKKADGKIKIDKVWAVMDCGWYVNPDIVRAQVEGSIVMAYGAAAVHETHFMDGKAVETNFHQYKMPRITDIPEIEVHIMDNDEKPGGVGEPALPPFAPALCNAIFDLTGKRIRKLPFDINEV